ncbi:MAG: glutamyl-tRNA reductase [Planctomycetaceae bacterium]|nr:glutamyl-tRNA reductase [Planctomycetaceae bacterium]
MKLQMVGCSYHSSSLEMRERLAFTPAQIRAALDAFRVRFPAAEAVFLSTCNRVEIYTAAESPAEAPQATAVEEFLAQFHGLEPHELSRELNHLEDAATVRHLFSVAASLDSMVLGEPQILAQVKQAYQLATEENSAGPLTHATFQAALKVARRVASETTINQRRVSVASVAIGDFARQVFERFDDKKILVLGAGEMAEETLRYLTDEGARNFTVLNRGLERAYELAGRWGGEVRPWERLHAELVTADLVVSTTGAPRPIVTLSDYLKLEPQRYQRPLFVVDLAVPRDFDPAIGERLQVYLYTIDDLRAVCEQHRQERDREIPAAERIVDEEAARFMADLYHRATGPIIQQLKQDWQRPKDEELRRLFNRLPNLDLKARAEIEQSFERLVNKLLHPPLESLRDEAQHGPPHGLVDALKRLFQLTD